MTQTTDTAPASTRAAQTFAGRRAQSWFARWWFAVCAIALIIGSDYKFRHRSPLDALSATVDREILIELGLYGIVATYLLFLHNRNRVPGAAPNAVPHASSADLFRVSVHRTDGALAPLYAVPQYTRRCASCRCSSCWA